jgi:ABC-type branched-subunit amino acid transport system ATPase component/ABC-type branched-subunit amino acid transport system permease subunit
VAIRTGGNPISLLVGGLAAAVVTIIIGLPALRIRGLFLAVTTLSFAVAMTKWVLIQPWALEDGLNAGSLNLAGREIGSGRPYYFFALVIFLLMFLLARNIRTAGLGLLLRAVRDNEDAARSFGIRASKIKIQGFLIGGFVAGIGGAIYGHLFSEIGVRQFSVEDGVDVVVMSVAGGIAALAGPVLGISVFKGLPAFVPLQSLGLLATRLGPLLLILYLPGGLVQMIAPLRERTVRWLGRRMGVVQSVEEVPDVEASSDFVRARSTVGTGEVREKTLITEDKVLLSAKGLNKTYGGLAAVSDVSLSINEGETLGLIGPNGAGKTTLFEVLTGFVGADGGRVLLGDKEITQWSPERRARAGLIRSFQDVTLFPTLTVLDTIQLALERQIPTTLAASLLGPSSKDHKRQAAARDIAGSLGLWDFRNKQIQELSTGTRRITELACLVGLRPTLLLLDEPSSGIAQRETEALGLLLQDLKAEHEMTLFIIEHDIPLVMGLADRVIAMDAGSVIAEGTPDEVKNDPEVVEAYLGGRIEAIERSGLRQVADLSELEAIPGLGPARRAALIEAFGSIEAVREASVEELAAVKGVSSRLAAKVRQKLE